MVRILKASENNREMEVARQVARNLHEFTLRDFIIAFVLDTLCEGLLASPVVCLNRLVEEGSIERYEDGKYRVVSSALKKCHNNRVGCIVLYTIEHCYWCEVVKEQVQEILTTYGYSNVVIKEINVDKLAVEDITTLPMIDLCSQRIIGYHEENDLANSILKVVVKACFG